MAAIITSSPTSKSHTSYEGQYDAQGLYNGQGILTTNQTTYEGNFRHGVPLAGTWQISTPSSRYSGDAKIPKQPPILPQMHGSGNLKDTQTKAVYIGQFQNNQRHGTGTLVTTEGVIEGRWKNDILLPSSNSNQEETNNNTPPPQNGTGTITTKNGSTYIGNFLSGKRHGHGIYKDIVSSITYDGEWINDLRSGHGILFDADNNNKLIYDGEWCNDKKTHGKCFDTIEKWSYEGELKSDQFHGHGTFIDAFGSTYIGEFQNGKRHGHGCEKKILKNTTAPVVYVGEWMDNARHGNGEELNPDGSGYIGTYKNNFKNGNGKETITNGDTREGTWMNGVPIFGAGMEWTLHYISNSEKYVGECVKDFQPNTFSRDGTFKYASGDVFKGGFMNGVRHGKGVMYHSSGDVEEDVWIDGVTESLMKLLT